ncbi:MAG: acetylglucosamine-6-sulfatase, partial [Planctomycetota bacterium]|nr:acetylglucosamine-6-sulfatase [Planctomycetota bacterium]
YASSEHQAVVEQLKRRLADLRRRVGDDGSHFPECEKVVQEFWDYDKQDQLKAEQLSREYLQRRHQELEQDVRNPRTWMGQ